MSWKITPLYLYTLDKKSPPKEPAKVKFSHFWVTGWKFTNFLYHVWEITLLYVFSRKCLWFGQKEPIKVQNFRLSTTHVKLHHICTLIDSFCWKYIKSNLKKYIGVMPHDSEDWCKIWRKTICCLENDKNFVNFDLSTKKSQKLALSLWFLLCKVLKVWPKKYRGVVFHDTEDDAIFEEKLTRGLEKEMRNMANFHQSTWKSHNWDVDGVL